MEEENLIWEWIEKFENLNAQDKINDKLIQKLWTLIIKGNDIYFIREKYKKILENIKKYNNNYYAHICIALNVLETKKHKLKKNIITNQDIKYIKQRIVGELTTIGEKTTTVRYILKEVEYDYINYFEGIGNEKTKELLDELIKEAKSILRQERLDLEMAKKWVKKYRYYIILTYGRWTKEYEKYMNTAFEIPVFGTSPNLLLLAMRETMRKGIEVSINEIT